MTRLAALILAGTRAGGDPLAASLGLPHKSLIELEGQTLLSRVVHAVRLAGIERIFVSCDDERVSMTASELGVRTIGTGAGPSTSVSKGFEIAGAPLLVTTSDHGLLRPDWILELIDNTTPGSDLSVMLAEKTVVESAVPATKRTYLRFSDGSWSGCNLFYLATDRAKRAIDTWALVEAHRKQPWKIAARLGPMTLLAMAMRRLTLADGLSRLGSRIGVKAQLVPASSGLAAVDIDKASDLDLARRLLSAPRYDEPD